jgi:hypothetical protein
MRMAKAALEPLKGFWHRWRQTDMAFQATGQPVIAGIFLSRARAPPIPRQ